jgi:hypothetical protein
MSWKKIRLVVVLCAGVGWLFTSLNLSAEPNPWLEDDRFKLSAGTFISDYNSDFRLSNDKLGIGTRLSFEDHLGLEDSKTVFRLAGHYRFSAKHRMDFSYVDLSRDGTAITTFPIIIDDTFYRRGTRLKTRFDYRVIKLAYAYSFWQTDKYDISASAGGYIFNIDLNLTPSDGPKEGESGTAPFPMFGLHLYYRFNERLMLNAGYQYFTINKNDIEGELIDVILSLEYKAFEKVGLGIGYNNVSIYAEDSDDNDEFEFEYDGILAYITYSF